MRVRKRPDLRLNIPSYPRDYVEMPPETKKLILEANRTPNDLQYIDDDDEPGPSNTDIGVVSPTVVKFHVGLVSPSVVKFQDDIRSPTPEVRFTDPEGNIEVKKSDLEVKKEVKQEHSPVIYRRHYQRGLSAPVLAQHEIEALRMAYAETVSGFNRFVYNYQFNILVRPSSYA